ncbi:MAG: Flp pilus assembly protein CpaB [Bacteroidota bacterium]
MKRSNRLILAAAIGLVATGGLYFALARAPKAESAIPTEAVLVAVEPIPPNTKIMESQFAPQERPSKFVPAGSIRDPRVAVGRVAKENIYPGEALLEEKLMPPGAQTTLAFPLPEGCRAVTVAVDEVVGVGGFLMPGTFVDVVSTIDVDNKPATKVILQKIQVLAIAQDAAKKDSPQAKIVSSATLAVTPEDAEKLVLAADKGRIRLAIRAPKEDRTINTTGVTSESLLGVSKPAPVKVATRVQKVEKSVLREKTVYKDRVIKVIERPTPRPEPPIMVIRGGQIEMIQR